MIILSASSLGTNYMLVENINCFVHHDMHNPSKSKHAAVLLADMEQQMDEVLALLKAKPASKPQSISDVGSAEADSVLLELGFLQDDGNKMDPVAVPAGSSPCPPFD